MKVNFNVINQKDAPALYEDALALRPAPSFRGRLFVDTDNPSTGWYRDTGTAWQPIAGGGGGGVNIYNSDGTLTSSRTLNGNSNSLVFTNLADFQIFTTFGNLGLQNGFSYIQTAFMQFTIAEFDKTITTSYQNNNVGLNIDFVNTIYQIGQITQNNQLYLELRDNQKNASFNYQGNIRGLFLDFNLNIYTFGSGIPGGCVFQTDDLNNRILTSKAGIKFDYAIDEYYYGDYDQTYTKNKRTYLKVKSTLTDQVISTIYDTNENGLKLDFANQNYRLGDGISNNIFFDTPSNTIELNSQNNPGIIRLFVSGLNLFSMTSTTIQTIYGGGSAKGIDFDFIARTYKLGETAQNNATHLLIDDNNQLVQFNNLLNPSGLSLDYNNKLYSLGDFNNILNGSKIDIDDSVGFITMICSNGVQNLSLNLIANDPYPIQANGTNVLSGTSGSVSGQHLKIRINGVNYKIELKNP